MSLCIYFIENILKHAFLRFAPINEYHIPSSDFCLEQFHLVTEVVDSLFRDTVAGHDGFGSEVEIKGEIRLDDKLRFNDRDMTSFF